jgi:hypothetical protein
MVACDFAAREKADQGRFAEGLTHHAEFRMALAEVGPAASGTADVQGAHYAAGGFRLGSDFPDDA